MSFKTTLRNQFPDSTVGKVIATVGYLLSVFGFVLVAMYLRGFLDVCIQTSPSLTLVTWMIAGGQLLASIITLWLTRGLRNHTTALYLFIVFVVWGVILIAELGTAMGFAFAAGTACTNG